MDFQNLEWTSRIQTSSALMQSSMPPMDMLVTYLLDAQARLIGVDRSHLTIFATTLIGSLPAQLASSLAPCMKLNPSVADFRSVKLENKGLLESSLAYSHPPCCIYARELTCSPVQLKALLRALSIDLEDQTSKAAGHSRAVSGFIRAARKLLPTADDDADDASDDAATNSSTMHLHYNGQVMRFDGTAGDRFKQEDGPNDGTALPHCVLHAANRQFSSFIIFTRDSINIAASSYIYYI
jgi:hypothetical protein